MARPTVVDKACEYRAANRALRRAVRVAVVSSTVCCTAAAFAGAALILWLNIGFRPILSASMRPTFAPGWLVVTRPLPTRRLRPGDIILFVPPGRVQAFAHRVVTVSGPADRPVVTTRGDANPAVDPWHARITSAHVTQVVGEVPWLGRVMLGLERPALRLVLILLGGTVVCAAGTRAILRPATPRGRPTTATSSATPPVVAGRTR